MKSENVCKTIFRAVANINVEIKLHKNEGKSIIKNFSLLHASMRLKLIDDD